MPDPDPPPSRWRVTAYAAVQTLWAVPLLVLLVLFVAGGVLVLVWVGLAVLLAVIPVLRAVANVNRAMAARVLGAPVPVPYRRPPADQGVLVRLRGQLADPMTWRDLLWVLWSATFGFLLSLLVVVLFLPVVTGAIWWYGAYPLMRIRSAVDRALLTHGRTDTLEDRVQVLTRTRAEAVDHSAAELRRIERDLHDGAQARLVALSMNLGRAERLLAADPETAHRLLAEARSTTKTALGELRSVVRGIHPPVLADRGLGSAVQALALDMGVPVVVTGQLAGRAPAPVESAVYFAVAECLANLGKHAAAGRGWITLGHADGVLRVVVGDDGRGGADPDGGSGLRGVLRRLAAFDGTMTVASPPGGPTLVSLEVPCALSSPRTTLSSGPA